MGQVRVLVQAMIYRNLYENTDTDNYLQVYEGMKYVPVRHASNLLTLRWCISKTFENRRTFNISDTDKSTCNSMLGLLVLQNQWDWC